MELLVVLVLIALLASLATPIVTTAVQRAKEAALKENLLVLRKAIDDYYTDKATYPGDLQTLVDARYIRAVPADPITERKDSWVFTYAESQHGESGIIDVRSGAELRAGDGTSYSEW